MTGRPAAIRLAVVILILLGNDVSLLVAQQSISRSAAKKPSTWERIGPDSANWMHVTQFDAIFPSKGMPHLGLVTTRGIALNTGGGWKYVYRNPTDAYFPIPPTYDIYYYARSFFFSRWNDSVAFIARNGYGWEGGTEAYTVRGILQGNSQWYAIDNYWVGPSPHASFVFPRSDTGTVYLCLSRFDWSSDNGLNWRRSSTEAIKPGYFVAINLRIDSLLYFGGANTAYVKGIYASSDRGQSWRRAYSFLVDYLSVSFVALGNTLVFGTYRSVGDTASASGIFRSTDQGATWSQVLDGIDIEALASGGNGQLFAAGGGRIFLGNETGESWSTLMSVPFPTKITGLAMDPHGDTLYVATGDSGLYKVHDFITYAEPNSLAANDYRLSQNYPNPFNSSTVITYTLARGGNATLRVHDLLGRTIFVLVNRHQDSGTHEVTFDSALLSSGIYFYDLRVNDYSATRKMVIIK